MKSRTLGIALMCIGALGVGMVLAALHPAPGYVREAAFANAQSRPPNDIGDVNPAHWLILAIFFAMYFLPTMLGWKKQNRAAIFTVNFFLGWTVIGWVVAFVWAVAHDPACSPPEASMKHITSSSSTEDLHWAVYALRDRLEDLVADARLLRKCSIPDGCDVCRAEGLLQDLFPAEPHNTE